MLQAPGLQERENLPGWRLEEEFLVSAPARSRGGGEQRAERKEIRPRKKSQPDGGKLSPGRGKSKC